MLAASALASTEDASGRIPDALHDPNTSPTQHAALRIIAFMYTLSHSAEMLMGCLSGSHRHLHPIGVAPAPTLREMSPFQGDRYRKWIHVGVSALRLPCTRQAPI